MDRSDVITLVSVTRERDNKGVYSETETTKDVFCSVRSASSSEFFEGGKIGLKPEFQFTLFAYDYDEEEVVIYKNKRYKVYRTYFATTDLIELYVQREGSES